MTDKMREALKLARKALTECGEELNRNNIDGAPTYDDALEAIDAALAQPEQRGEVIPQYRRRGAIEWYDGYADHEDSCGPYEERVVYTAPPAPVVPARTTKDWCITMAKLEAGHSVTAGCYAKPLTDVCRLPPDGWLCTREPGHDGPCAAVFHAPPAPAVPDDTARLNWLEGREASLVTHREAIDEGEFAIWWTVTGEIRKIRSNSISGHPLGSVRSAIDAAMLAAAPEVKP